MAYNALPEVAAGDNWTAADINTYFRDNFAAGVPDIFTTKGDIAVASGNDAADRLAVGANDSVLFADSAATLGVRWAIPAFLGATDTATLTYIHQTNSTMLWQQVTNLNTESWDIGANFAADAFTAPHPGYYLVTGFLHWRKGDYQGYSDGAFAADEDSYLALYKNGTKYSVLGMITYESNGLGQATLLGEAHSLYGSDIILLAQGDVLKWYFATNTLINVSSPSTQASLINENATAARHHVTVTYLSGG